MARLAPDHVVVPLAVERSRGWFLSPDHGATLASLGSTDDVQWMRVVAEFANLQRRVAGDGARLAAAGLAPLLPAMAADHVGSHVERMRQLPPDDSLFIPAELADRAIDALPQLREIAARLDGVGPALASLEHNDLHQNNVFIPDPDETTLHFFDFGDSLWAHPFTSMAVPVGVLCGDWETEPDDPRIRRVVDSFLDVWSDLGTRAELRETERLTRLLWPVHRFESWRRLVDGSSVEGHEEDIEAVLYWLGRVAETPAV